MGAFGIMAESLSLQQTVSIPKRICAERKKLLMLEAGTPSPPKNAVDRQCGDVFSRSACQKINTPLPLQEIPSCAAQGDPRPPRAAELVHNA
jgi:hypothetical protein